MASPFTAFSEKESPGAAVPDARAVPDVPGVRMAGAVRIPNPLRRSPVFRPTPTAPTVAERAGKRESENRLPLPKLRRKVLPELRRKFRGFLSSSAALAENRGIFPRRRRTFPVESQEFPKVCGKAGKCQYDRQNPSNHSGRSKDIDLKKRAGTVPCVFHR